MKSRRLLFPLTHLVCYDEQPDEFESSKVLLLPLQGKEVDPCF